MAWWPKKTANSENATPPDLTSDDIGKQIQNEVSKALTQLETNTADAETVRARIASAISGGYDFADTLHNVYLDFGYPQKLAFSNFWNMYRRFGIAENVVELPVDTTWMTLPTLKTSDKFLSEFEKLVTQVKFWQRVKGLDMRQRVGRYAGMFMRVRDGKKPDQKLEGKLSGPGSLIQMIPIYEGQLKVLETEQDVMSDNYGQPTMYLYSTSAVGSRNEKQNQSISIHPSRLIMAAEDADDGSIYGTSCLESCYNSLLDLRKIIGAGGEGFYKNASQSVIFKLMDPSTAIQNKDLLDKLGENHDDFMRNRMRRSMWTPGLEPSVLNSMLIDPKEFFAAALNDVAAASKIPATVLIGQQTGRLASTEDSKSYLSGINSRRANYGTELLTTILDWLIEFGLLPNATYEIEWDNLLELSDEEKLKASETMSTINQKQYQSGGETAFTAEEIRLQAGYDPLEEPPEEGEQIDQLERDDDSEEEDSDDEVVTVPT